MRRLLVPNLLVVVALSFAGCDPSGERPRGLGPTVRAGGPVVVWDVAHTPLPEIPLPNDQATRLDPTSPTGRRLNVAMRAVTRYEEKTRRLFDRLDGFGAYAPITVRFDRPLDLADVVRRHTDNDDFRDDAFFLLNVDRSCKRFGEEVALEVGRRRFPVTLMGHTLRIPDPLAPGGHRLDEGPNKLFRHDPRGESLNVLFPDWTEDANGNGTLDPGEDRDGDGLLTEANFLDPHACDGVPPSTPAHDRCVADHLLTWWERATNTLILRPVWPLEERCTHAVVLTKRLRGVDGKPVESPFPLVHTVDQTGALGPVPELVARYGLSANDVAFAWTFTVGTMTKDVELVRQGLYGVGPLARLGGEFPVSGLDVWTRDEWRALTDLPKLDKGGDAQLLSGGCATAAYATIAGTGDGDKQICGGYADYASIGGVFAGTFDAPNLLVDKDGAATPKHPADEDESFALDAEHGEAVYGRTKVSFFCVLPRQDAKPPSVRCEPGNPTGQPWCKPYPVVFYAHGYGSFKGEFIQHAGRHAQMGMAGCGLDSFGHGRSIVLDRGCPGAFEFKVGQGELGKLGVPELATMIYKGRDRDLDNDGCAEGGADQWTADLFHTRDVVRQSVIEQMQFVRILHAMDGVARDGRGRVLGDVDGDGSPDLGGPKNTTAAWGISLGGQLTAVLAGAEPTLDVVSPNAVGSGLTDISVRLGEGGLAEAVMLPVMGPLVVGCLPTDEHQRPLESGAAASPCLPQVGEVQPETKGPQKAGELLLGFYAHNLAKFAVRAFARVPGVRPGDAVVVENLDKKTTSRATIGPRGSARVHFAADAADATARRKILGLADDDKDPKVASDTTLLGDRLRVTVVGPDGAVRATVATFDVEVTFQGATYAVGQPLVALQEGLGYARNTPDFRRFYGIAQHAISPADPAVWSARYFDDPILAPYDPAWWPGRTHVLVMPTVGDGEVPAATGVSLARTSGLLGSYRRDPARFPAENGWRELFAPDPRYGVSIERWLADRWVIEGDHRFQRFAGYDVNPNVLFDPDDVSDGTARFSCLHAADWSADNGEFRCPAELDDKDVTFGVPHPPAGKALRRDRLRADGTLDAFRIPLLRPAGQHGIYNPQPFRAFDADAFMVNTTARFMASRARNLKHEAGCDCAYAARPEFEISGKPAAPGVEDVPTCPDGNPAYGKVCSASCATAWGLVPIPKTVCAP